jgi:hypothetical protein
MLRQQWIDQIAVGLRRRDAARIGRKQDSQEITTQRNV